MNENTPNQVEITARAFSKVLKEWIGAVGMAQTNALNANESDPLVCHSHDFCDANMAMDEALRGLGVDMDWDDEEGMPQWINNLWNAAWSMAVDNDFYVKEPEMGTTTFREWRVGFNRRQWIRKNEYGEHKTVAHFYGAQGADWAQGAMECIAALQNLKDRDLIKDTDGDHYEEVLQALEKLN
jgi:hypothetical protein